MVQPGFWDQYHGIRMLSSEVKGLPGTHTQSTPAWGQAFWALRDLNFHLHTHPRKSESAAPVGCGGGRWVGALREVTLPRGYRAHFSQPGKGRACKSEPSVCWAGLMKTETGFREAVSSPHRSEVQLSRNGRKAEMQGSKGI